MALKQQDNAACRRTPTSSREHALRAAHPIKLLFPLSGTQLASNATGIAAFEQAHRRSESALNARRAQLTRVNGPIEA
jgi:hypothetical protein